MVIFLLILMTPVHIVQGQLSQKIRSAVLRNGSTVTGRILSKDAESFYTVSIAGQKISVKSEANLAPGSFFSARVSVKNGLVELSLIKENADSGGLVQKFTPEKGSLSPQIADFLTSLGFEPNESSLKLFQFMHQLGMKIDIALAKKTLRSSQKDSDADGEKSQILLLLEEKGIKSSDERVSAILGKNQRDSGDSERKSKNKEAPALGLSTFPQKINSSDIKKFFESVDAASLNHKHGVLTAFNTVLSAKNKESPLRHWILLPFEWDFQKSNGVIKLLFDSELKNLQKLIIDIKNTRTNRIFSLSFKDNKPDSVKFASNSEDDYSSPESLSLFSSLFPFSMHLEQVDFDSLRGFAVSDEELSFVRGEA
ncbi:MAG: hypothetical protein IJ530_13570 [Treponema sp.]|uniref:hypothetical protein n=1 Tax=Treponema sp. TaxID=166 RepID=UPI0025F31A81|nr:hypothetical protein [Treponema sp.]MBQ8680761.1 hypothetical protein [Treponema sp.]